MTYNEWLARWRGFENSDTAVGEWFHEEYGSSLVSHDGEWYEWRDTHYVKCGEHGARKHFQIFAQSELITMNSQEGNITTDDLKRMMKLLSTRTQDAILRGCQYRFNVDAFDTDPDILATPSGICDLKTGQIRPAACSDLVSRCTRVSPSNKGYKQWEEFLDYTFKGDWGVICYIQQLFGSFLFGKVKEEILVMPYGIGGNGKSVFTGAILEVMGSYATEKNPRIFAAGTKEAESRFSSGALEGYRYVLCSEMPQGSTLDVSQMKALCSNDQISAERKYGSEFSFKPSHHFVLTGNELPTITQSDEGTWRRPFPIPFTNKVEGRILNTGQREQLVNESGEAILQWLIDGAVCFAANDYKLPRKEDSTEFELPEPLEIAKEEYRLSSDWVAQFVHDCCVKMGALETASSTLRQAYIWWCGQNDRKPLSAKVFKERLASCGYLYQRQRSGIFVQGLGLTNDVMAKMNDIM